ncbi:histidinol-phosphate transaminase [Streptomyces sp. NBC_01497]|nr:histidinol-phosphate transaminase [Streptomyces sp. NBC_01497]
MLPRVSTPASRRFRAGKVPMTPYGLSANENPYAPLPSVRQVVADTAAQMNRYPDRLGTAVTEAVAARFAVPASHLAFGAGSVGVLLHLLHSALAGGGNAVYAWPSFEAYPHLTQVCGGASVRVPLREDTHDLDAMADAVTDDTRVVVVCNPNNPTGTVVRRAALERFLDRVPERVLVVLDEAYREFVRDIDVPDGIDLYRERPNVVVLRTFSKAYGLAGLRIGFAVARAPVAEAIRARAVPFGIGSAAQAAAVASLDAEDELLERVAALVKERDRVENGLRDAGLRVPPSQANFVWLPFGAGTEAFADECAEQGVAVRAFPGEGARVTIGEVAANDIVLRIAAAHGGRAG